MKTIYSILTILIMSIVLNSCSSDDNSNPVTPGNNGNNGNNGGEAGSAFKVRITVGNEVLTASFEDNATTRAFKEILPATLPMMDLYDREMCYRFTESFPANEARSRGYEVGEIIYYPGGRSFVIFYNQTGISFNMQYLGRVDSNVEVFKNMGDVDVSFELIGD